MTKNRHHAACGHVRIGPQVAIRVDKETGRASFGGLASCGLIWECAVCSSRIRAERAAEVQAVVAWHVDGGDVGRAALLTLTVRHEWGQSLPRLRSGVAAAWQRFVNGAPWKRFSEKVGLVGFIRALEVTHGKNGWHPHLHVVLLTKHPAQLWAERAWLSKRWRDVVVAELGAHAEPSDFAGLDLAACHKAEYLSKLGLETVGAGEKKARGENRSPWEILEDICDDGQERDVALWVAWCDGIKRARMLTWSRDLRERAGLGEERSDEDIVDELEGDELMRIDGAVWDAVRNVPGVAASLLEAAEVGGRAEVEPLIVESLAIARREGAG